MTLPAVDVLVIGAGPAGSACAQLLARAGRSVMLADQHDFPRDKVCGDGLIPAAHAAFERLGVAAQVNALAQENVLHVRCVAPGGRFVDVPGRLAVVPRRVLDDILRTAAIDAGAVWLPRARFEAPQLDTQQNVVGARLNVSGETLDVSARWVVLATGAQPQALIASDVCDERTPSGVALRGYVHHPPLNPPLTTMDVVWHRKLGRGYGWIFPCGDGVYNIGVGLSNSHDKRNPGRRTMADVNLRTLFDVFCKIHAPAGELLAHGKMLGALKGAPLRCSLEGARLSRPGLLVTGEAAGSTYAFTGEGIGKAMETGMLAAQTLLEDQRWGAQDDAAALHAFSDDAALRQRYEQRVLALKPRFDLYERANRLNDMPWLIDLLVWRASRSPRVLRRMGQVLEEKGNPGNLVTWRGVAKLLVPGR